jgi:uncharacterized membrane protein YcaP (DUF421 family)
MHPIAAVDWHALLVPTVSLLELVLRGSIVYLGILIALRLFRREAGGLSTADLLVIVLVADAAQNAMSTKYGSVPEGLVLVSTIFAWNLLLDWLSFRSPLVHKWIHPAPASLVINGRVQRRALRAELLTFNDLMEQLREHGIEDVAEVKRCCLEGDGHLSVIRRQDAPVDAPRGSPAH